MAYVTIYLVLVFIGSYCFYLLHAYLFRVLRGQRSQNMKILKQNSRVIKNHSEVSTGLFATYRNSKCRLSRRRDLLKVAQKTKDARWGSLFPLLKGDQSHYI